MNREYSLFHIDDPFEPPAWRAQWVEQQEQEFNKKREAKNGCLVSQECTTRRAIMLEVLPEGSAWNALGEEEEQGDMYEMKAIRLYGQSGPDQFVFEDVPQPQPGVGEVLIRVHATSVMWQEPTWSETWQTPAGIERQHPIPGHDVSGEIVEVGPGVTGVTGGEAVYALTEFWRDGAAAEYTVASATDVAPKPRTLGHIQAAGVPLVGLTAWQALFEHAGLTSGQALLIHGAAGGVGSMAVQMAKWAGATVIATASARHHAFLRTLGADEIIEYTTTRFEEVVREVDIVLDTIGGETEARSWQVVKKGGLLLSVFRPPSQEQAAAFGVRALFFIVKPNREQLMHIGDLIDAGQLRPITERVFPLSEASQAFEQALQGHARGKIILRVEDEERRDDR